MTATDHDLWVFGYGSLMWRPGFDYIEAQHARLVGYRRCFCIYSVHHRGRPDRPGLVLGLDRGGACEGIAFRVAAANAAAITHYLRQREQTEGVYREAHLPVELVGDRREVTALAFIVERAHCNYAGQLPVATQARVIRSAEGVSGANLDYLINTLRHLEELGIRERELERVLAMIGPFTARDSMHGPARSSAAALLGAARTRPPVVRRKLQKDHSRRFLYRLHYERGG